MYTITELINSLNDVPAMPNIIMRALSIVRDEESSMKELAQVISYDQSLSTKILTLVNSAYYGFPQQISSIVRAISLIGMSKTKNMILAVAMKPMLTNQGDKELWRHSIITAVGCEYLGKYLKIMEADESFVVGFLHDLGKMVLNIKDPKLYEQVRDTRKYNPNILDIEQSYFGTNHCQMGSLLAKRWQLPLLINNVIKYHHNPNFSSMPVACTLVYLVDNLVKDDFDENSLDPEVMENIKIKIEQPLLLKENIMTKANVLLRELSN